MISFRSSSCALVASTVLFAAASNAQTENPTAETAEIVHLEVRPIIRSARAPFVLEVGEHRLSELIDRTASWLGRNYLSAPGDLDHPGATIKVQTALQLDEDGLERALGTFLYARGYAIIALDEALGIYEVINMQGPRRSELHARATALDPDEALEQSVHHRVVQTAVVVHHIHAIQASNSLRPFFASSGSGNYLVVGNTGDDHTIVLQGFAPQVAAAIRLLRRADEAAADAARRAQVENLEQRIQQLEQRN